MHGQLGDMTQNRVRSANYEWDALLGERSGFSHFSNCVQNCAWKMNWDHIASLHICLTLFWSIFSETTPLRMGRKIKRIARNYFRVLRRKIETLRCDGTISNSIVRIIPAGSWTNISDVFIIYVVSHAGEFSQLEWELAQREIVFWETLKLSFKFIKSLSREMCTGQTGKVSAY